MQPPQNVKIPAAHFKMGAGGQYVPVHAVCEPLSGALDSQTPQIYHVLQSWKCIRTSSQQQLAQYACAHRVWANNRC